MHFNHKCPCIFPKISSLKLEAAGSYKVWYLLTVPRGVSYYSTVTATNTPKLNVPVVWLTLPSNTIRETHPGFFFLKFEVNYQENGYH